MISTELVAAAGVAIVVAALILRVWRRLHVTIEQQRAQLQTAIGNMSQGLLLFNAATQIVVVNRRYIEMYGLSADVAKPGCTLRELLCHRKATGTFDGDVDEYCAELQLAIRQCKPHRAVVGTPVGRWFQIVNQPLIDGGWVATHEDITERYRAEMAHGRTEALLREQKMRLDSALDNMEHGLGMFDADGRIVLFNQRYVQMMGVAAEFLLGRSLLEVFHQRHAAGLLTVDPEQMFNEILTAMRAGQTTTRVIEQISGTYLRVINHPMPEGGFVSTFEDITEQRRAEQERDRNREFLDLIIENVPAAIFVKNAGDRRYVLVNRAAEQFWGISRGEILNRCPHDFFAKEEADLILARDEELLRAGQTISEERRIHTPSNGFRSIQSKRLVLTDQSGRPRYLVGVVEDVTERKLAEERIAHLAHHDALTGLPNRVLLGERLEQELKFVRRGGQLALLYLDVDHFKGVNDTLGHPVGDKLLVAVTTRLGRCLKDTDFFARLGGDEFAIVQTSLARLQDAAALAQRLRDVTIATPFNLDGHQVEIDLSIGIAIAPDDGSDVDHLLKNADMALYGAKSEGRGTYRYFEPQMDTRMKARRALETDLRKALVNGEFELHYQPVMGIETGEVTGCEALLRWRHPDRGLILPGEFITLAEEMGLITPIGEWVVRQACAEAACWPDGISVAINVSVVQLRTQSLLHVVPSALAASGLRPERLELEITESVLMQNSDKILRTLHAFHQLGVRIALDDFGTGYSSLSYLRSFPFDKIKIDRSFVHDLADGGDALKIIETIIRLARALGMTVTAEGVQTQQQMDLLCASGCMELQGYFFSRPVPARELAQLLFSRPERVLKAV